MILSRSGFIGCVHCTLDDGVFPRIAQSKTRWQGLDGSTIDAFGRIPLDANRPETFASFSQKLAESMDFDHVAAVALVHWPGQVTPWFEDLKRIHAYAPLFGKFVTLEHFFEHTDMPGRLDKFEADDYRAPYLRQMVERREADPISRFARAIECDLKRQVCHSAKALGDLIRDRPPEPDPGREPKHECNAASALRDLAALVASSPENAAGGNFAFNPFAQPARLAGYIDENASDSSSQIEVPAIGFAWAAQHHASQEPRRGKPPQSPASQYRLANEHMEVIVDPATGGIRSIRDFRHRGNRLSQQLALRLPGSKPATGEIWSDEDRAIYSVMAADQVETNAAAPARDTIVSRGRLLDRAGNLQAGFEQRIHLARGSRVLVIDSHIDPAIELPPDPWNAYYACRFAWADESAELYRSVHQTTQRTRLKRLEAPHFVEIREDRKRTAILAAGLSFHRRDAFRMLDTLLIVAGETRRDFRIGIGLDLPAIAISSQQLIFGDLPCVEVGTPPSDLQAGWFFHLDSANVMTLDWTCVIEDGKCVGFRLRLLETEGRAGRTKLRTFKPVAAARQIDSLGSSLATLSVSTDAIFISFSAFELIEVEAHWAV